MRKLALITSCLILLSACAPGPDSSIQLAQQGLLSGALSADGKTAVVGSIHHGGSLWELSKKERLYDWNHQSGQFSSMRSVAISGNGLIAVTSEEKNLVVWDASTGKSLGFWEAADRVLAIALNANGSRALIGMRDGTLDYFDLKTGQVLQRMQHEAEVRSVALAQIEGIGVSGSDDFTARSWDLNSGKELARLNLSNQVKTVGISGSGKLAFTSAQRSGIKLWEPASGKVAKTIDTRFTNYSSMRFTDDENFMWLGTSAGMIEYWSISKAERLQQWEAEPRQAWGGASSKAIIAISAQGKEARVLTADGLAQHFKP